MTGGVVQPRVDGAAQLARGQRRVVGLDRAVGPCVCCGEDHGLGRGEVEFAAVAPRPQLAELSASVGIARGFPRRVADGLGVARVDLMKAESKSRP